MRFLGTVMMAAVGASAWAAETGEARVSSVTVCLDKGGPGVDSSAQTVASKVFGAIAVKINWVEDGSCPASLDAIKVTISHKTPENLVPKALAYALPLEATHFKGAQIAVFWDRIKRPGRSVSAPQLLAYVLVHEIVHVLQGINRHSAAGIMKAYWNYTDYYKMALNTLRFTADDIDLIHLGLQHDQAQRVERTSIAARQ